MSDKNNKVLYVGVTNNLKRRVYEHKNHLVQGFTSKYHVEKLVYYEQTENPVSAIEREKQIKKWTRQKKEALIDLNNKGREEIILE